MKISYLKSMLIHEELMYFWSPLQRQASYFPAINRFLKHYNISFLASLFGIEVTVLWLF